MRSRSLVRSVIAFCLVMGAPLVDSPAMAQEVEALRREVEQLRRQLQSLTERLQAIEPRREPTATAPPAAPAPAVSQAPSAPGGQPSLTDLARPRQPFALSERRGPGQLLFDIGLSSDFVGNITHRNVEKARGGTFPGRENRFFPRAIELGLFGQIDPYARGEVRIEAAEEFEDGKRSIRVDVAEAHLTLLTVPWGFQVKMGKMLNRFGLLNQVHEDDLPQTDRPWVLTRFFGEEGLNENGAEVTWVAPLPFFLEALVGVFNGDNDAAFGRASLKAPLLTGRLRTFFELNDENAIQLGVSAASGATPDKRQSTLAGVDLKYKLRPDGWPHTLLTLAGEALYSNRRVEVFGDPDGDGVVTGERRTRQRFGWYAYGEVRPWKRWALGVRYDWTQFPVSPGHEWAVGPYLAFMPSEFLRFRLGYKHTDRSERLTGPDDRGSASIADEILFQATFRLGAHPAHSF